MLQPKKYHLSEFAIYKASCNKNRVYVNFYFILFYLFIYFFYGPSIFLVLNSDNSMNKVFLQTNLERNFTNSLYIFVLSVNFENLTVRLNVFITSLMLTKFQENQR